MSTPTRSSLLIRIRDSNDTDSWSTFVTIYTPIVYRFAISRGLQPADAADLTQETLIDVARCIRRFEYEPERGRFRDWLAMVVRRRLIKFWERSKSSPPLENEPSGEGNEAEWIDTYQSEILRIGLEKVQSAVESHVWEAFEKTWKLGMSASQVSKQMKIPIDLVYSSKSRVLKRLECEIKKLGEDCVWIH